MGFLDIGFLEVLLILSIALIVFGPGKIPEIAFS
jgi:Sec-independent protein translocase protein TatA